MIVFLLNFQVLGETSSPPERASSSNFFSFFLGGGGGWGNFCLLNPYRMQNTCKNLWYGTSFCCCPAVIKKGKILRMAWPEVEYEEGEGVPVRLGQVSHRLQQGRLTIRLVRAARSLYSKKMLWKWTITKPKVESHCGHQDASEGATAYHNGV